MAFDSNGVKPEQAQFRIAERVDAVLAHQHGLACFSFRMPLGVAPLRIAFSIDIIRQLAIQDIEFMRTVRLSPPQPEPTAPRIIGPKGG